LSLVIVVTNVTAILGISEIGFVSHKLLFLIEHFQPQKGTKGELTTDFTDSHRLLK
jgi:hypothetical protein